MRFRPSILIPVTAVLLSAFIPEANGEDEAPSPSAEAKAKGKANAVLQQALPAQLTALFPIGRPFKGVAIPSYDGTRLKSVMNADSIVRIDDQFLDLVNLVIQVYNGAGEPETTISMDEAAYDLTIGLLTSKTPAKIEQPRFTMTGDQMLFDSNTQVSELEGNVRVVVPNAGKMLPQFGLPGMGGK
ncbi:MAG: LPS export ABC transporter periplasmic protein LptC [Verrucomicrobiales bacterium]|nr:LPS export ABC transporter periplasmic protein LptC [Verrucomicrobiales bacterium]